MPKSNVRRINGVEITGTPVAGDVPVASSATEAAWGAGSSLMTDAVILAPTTSARNIIIPTAADVIALAIHEFSAGQSVPLQVWRTYDGQTFAYVSSVDYGTFYAINSSGGAAFYGVAGDDSYGIHGRAGGTGSAGGAGVLGEGRLAPSGVFRSISASNASPTVRIQKFGASTAHLLDFTDGSLGIQSYVDHLGVFHGSVTGTVTGAATALKTTGADVDVSGSAPGVAGYGLVLTDATHATWQPLSNVASLWHNGSVSYHATLGAAKTAAVSGDLIEVVSGTFDETDLLKNGVHWFFHPGAKVTYTGSSNAAIFDDGPNGANGAVTCSIGGFGQFTHTGSGTPDAGVLNVVNNSLISLSAELCSSDKVVIYHNDASYLATVRIASRVIAGTGNYHTIRQVTGGTMYVDAQSITGTGNQPVIAANGNDTAERLIIRASRVSSTGAQAVTSANVGNLDLTVAGEITTTKSSAVDKAGSGNVTIRAASISQTGSAQQNGVLCGGSGTLTLDVPLISTAAASYYAVHCNTTGTLRLINARCVNTGTNGVAGYITAGSLVTMGSCVFTSHSGATDSVGAGSSVTLTNEGTISGNKALNANVLVAGDFRSVFFTPGGIVTKTENYTATSADRIILADASAGPFTITLPTAVGRSEVCYTVKKIDASGNAVTVATTSSQTIDGATTQIITVPHTALPCTSDGTSWYILP